MKQILFPSIGLFLLVVTTTVIYNKPNNTSSKVAIATPETINWLSWDEMVEAQKTTKKKVIIDVYTDWCGWCKQMDKTTFKDSLVAKYVNENLYAVKLDAESRKEYALNGHTFKYIDQGKSGVNELAYSLLDGQLSYPSIVYLNEDYNRITISPGYKDNKAMLKELKYIGDEIYNKKTWDVYSKENKN